MNRCCAFIVACAVGACSLLGAGTASLREHSFRELRFSSDGQWVLAQDEQTIFLLTADLHLQFTIAAAGANLAAFTPDSKQVFFVRGVSRRWAQQIVYRSPAAHLERWDLESARRAESTEIDWNGCSTATLSPDGGMLACVSDAGQLTISDTWTGKVQLKKRVGVGGSSSAGPVGYIDVRFSPDSRYVLLLNMHGSGVAEAYDLASGKRVELGGALNNLRHARATFISAATVAIAHEARSGSKQSITELLTFPSGRIVASQHTPSGRLRAAADPNFVMICAEADNWEQSGAATDAAAVDIRTGYAILSARPGLDIREDRYVAESAGGISLFERGRKLIATISSAALTSEMLN